MAYGITFETSKVDTVLSIVSLFCYANDYQDMQKRWEQQVTGVQPQGEDVQYVVIGGLDHTLQKELLELTCSP